MTKEITIKVPCVVTRYTELCGVPGFPILMVLDVDETGELTLKEAKFEDKHAGCFEDDESDDE